MLIGQTIAASDNTTGETYYTPWFPRQGNDATCVVEIINIPASADLEVEMETKNSEQVDSAAASAGSGNGNSTLLVLNFKVADTKELCRFKVTFTASGTSTESCHFRILSPSWQTTGAQSI